MIIIGMVLEFSEVNNSTVESINGSGINIRCYALSSTMSSYLLYITYDVQTQLNSRLIINNYKVTVNYNTGRGLEIGFDAVNTAHFNFHS